MTNVSKPREYVIETLGPNGAVTHRDEVSELPAGIKLGEWEPLVDGGEVASGTAPAYLGDKRAGHVKVRVTRSS